jgi:hypothetical protein
VWPPSSPYDSNECPPKYQLSLQISHDFTGAEKKMREKGKLLLYFLPRRRLPCAVSRLI